MSYAEGTVVSVEKSRAEIEAILRRYGADRFMSGWDNNNAMIGFSAKGRLLRFVLPVPDKTEARFTKDKKRTWLSNTEAKALQLWEAETRRRWRCLALAIKAKLEAVESGIATFEEEFLANIVMPDNRTVAESILGAIDEAYRTGATPKLLSAPEPA